jgi:hypothetical protein
MVGSIVFGSVLHSPVGYLNAFVVFVFVGCMHPRYAEAGRETLTFCITLMLFVEF